MDDQRLISRLIGHGARIRDAQFSPDGRLIATAADDETVRLWATETGGELRRYELRRFLGHAGPSVALAWAPDGRRLFSGGEDGAVLVFDTRGTGRRAMRDGIYRAGLFGDFIFSPDGQRIAATMDDGTVSVLDAVTLDPLGRCVDLFQPVAFDTNGAVLGFTRNWSLRRQAIGFGTSETLVTNIWPGVEIEGWSQSDDGRWLALGAEGGQARFFDLTRSEAALTLTNTHLAARVLAVAVSADGKLAAAADLAGAGVLVDLPSGRERLRFRTQRVPIALAISPDRRWLALGKMAGEVELRSLDAVGVPTAPLVLRGHSRQVPVLRFSPDSRRLLTGGGDSRLLFWLVGSDAEPVFSWQFRGPGNGYDQAVGLIHFSPEGGRLGVVIWDGRLRVFNLRP